MAYEITAAGALDAAAWHEVVSAALRHDLPDEPVPDVEAHRNRLGATAPGVRVRRWLALTQDSAAVGVSTLRLPDGAPGAPADFELMTHPAHRRCGVASALLELVLAAAQEDGRPAVVAEASIDSPGERFLLRHRFEPALAISWLRLDVRRLDREELQRVADAEPPGYALVAWRGVVDDAMAGPLARARSAMADAPSGDLAQAPADWDEARVRQVAQVVEGRGDALWTAAAVTPAGEVAGYTELVVPGAAGERAEQYDTVVVARHRGNGLGRWLKASLLLRLLDEFPQLAEVVADNAEDNVHMLGVNRGLGFTVTRRTAHFQRRLG